jgi:hypothetical protein
MKKKYGRSRPEIAGALFCIDPFVAFLFQKRDIVFIERIQKSW